MNMKRNALIILATLLLFTSNLGIAEEPFSYEWDENQHLSEDYEPELELLVLPQLKMRTNNGTYQFHFGEAVTLLEENSHDRKCKVRTATGQEGWLETKYLAWGYLIYINGGTNLSFKPGMRDTEFGCAACGWRMHEIAVVLWEYKDYLFIVTEDGFSGWVYKYDQELTLYNVNNG